MIGQAIISSGYRVVTAALPVAAWHEGWTLGRFISRHLRWAVMRRSVSKSAYLVELLLTPGPLLMSLIALSTWLPLAGVDRTWLVGALAVEQLLSAVTYTRMTGQRVPVLALAINPLRQWLTLGIWVLGWFVETVEWRGTAYRVGVASVLRPAAGAAVPARIVDEA